MGASEKVNCDGGGSAGDGGGSAVPRLTGSRTMLRKDFWSKTASAFVVWRPYCWRKASRGVGAVYECPKKVRDLLCTIQVLISTLWMKGPPCSTTPRPPSHSAPIGAHQKRIVPQLANQRLRLRAGAQALRKRPGSSRSSFRKARRWAIESCDMEDESIACFS